MIEAALYDLLNESIKVEKLLTTAEVADYFNRTATFDNRFTRNIASYSFGEGPVNCLLYTAPSARETAGGTGLVSLVNLLQRGTCNFRHMPVTWHFAPDLDLNNNQTLSAFRKMIKDLKPAFVCTLPGDLGESAGEKVRLALKTSLPEKHSSLIKAMFTRSGFELEKTGTDPVMGAGFFLLKAAIEPLLVELAGNCQFFRPELSVSGSLMAADKVYLLMASALIAMDSVIEKNCDINNSCCVKS